MKLHISKKAWKYSLLLFAITIAAFSLLYTNYLVKQISNSERTKARLWVLSIKKVFETDDNDFLNYLFLVRDSLSVPAIITDASNEIIFTRGLDTNYTFLSSDTLKNKRYMPSYYQSKLALMRSQNDPIQIEIFKKKYWYVYYEDTFILSQLRIFPYIQLTLVGLFLFVAYAAFSAARRSQQDRLWVGMAKETAHQLGTPISSLFAWLELLRAKENQPTTLSYLRQMDNDLQRLETIADRFSKIGSHPVLHSEKIYYVIDNFIHYFKPRISEQIEIHLSGSKEATVNLHIQLFEWVVENLMKNAVNAMEGRGNIYVRISNKERIGWIYIDISDTGKGIAYSKFKTIFEPGYTTRKHGWGLGLSLVKRIIEQDHQGKIQVLRSTIGIGTTFRIKLKQISNSV